LPKIIPIIIHNKTHTVRYFSKTFRPPFFSLTIVNLLLNIPN